MRITSIYFLILCTMLKFFNISSSNGQRNEKLGHLRAVGSDREKYADLTESSRRIAKSSDQGAPLAPTDGLDEGRCGVCFLATLLCLSPACFHLTKQNLICILFHQTLAALPPEYTVSKIADAEYIHFFFPLYFHKLVVLLIKYFLIHCMAHFIKKCVFCSAIA